MSRRARRIDTVEDAAATPEVAQPYAELGLKDDEYGRIREILGRRPTGAELAMYSVMWCEHCSYKSSKVHLRQFGEKVPPEADDILLVGIGENAGVVDVGQGYAVTFKVESHNHPSYVEPYQGAATGVGGIVRDILDDGRAAGRGHGPAALRAGRRPDTARVLPGVVAGIGGYGNCLGLPNIGGEVVFDPSYLGNPLVNALCVGVMRHEDIKLAKASGPGNHVVLFGAKTGGDGIGGVSVLASETFDAEPGPTQAPQRPGRRPVHREAAHRVLPGDLRGRPRRRHPGPRRRRAVLRDLRAGDAPAPAACTSMLDRRAAARRDARARGDPHERVAGAHVRDRRAAARRRGSWRSATKWDVIATVIGEVTDGDRLVIDWHGETIVDVPPRTVAHEGPVYERPYARPA